MELGEIIEAAREALDNPVISSTDDEVLAGVDGWEALARLALANQLRHIAEIDHRGLAGVHGARSTKALLQQRLRISGPDADARVRVACKVEQRITMTGQPVPPELPATTEALRDGEICLDHAKIIVAGIRKVSGVLDSRQCEHAEAMLVEQSRMLEPKDLQTVTARLIYHCDQDGALRDEERQFEDRELYFCAAQNGMTLLKGRLDREAGAKLRAALEPLAAPRPEKDGTKDPRTAGQRNADALTSVLDIALSTDDLPRAGGQRPHLAVTVPWESLRDPLPLKKPTAPGILENTGQPLTAAQTRRIACDADVRRIVLSGDGQPLDVGRAHRTAPAHIRAALLARDSSCAFPACDHPPGTPEAHHLVSWVDGGRTDLNNMIMLCGAHHRIVHSQGWEIDLTSGRPVFIPPSIVDPWRRPRPGNRPLHQLDLGPSITDEREHPHGQVPVRLREFTVPTNADSDPNRKVGPSMELRKATPADVPAIQAVIAASYRKYLDHMDRPPAPMLRDYNAAIQAGDTWVAGDPVTGVISLVQEGDSLLVENVAVDPATQGTGLGRRLMDFAEQQAALRGLGRLTLYTNEAMTENQAIYTHLGYEERDRRTENGYQRVFMEKIL